jgi:hypothetical protein
MNLRSAFKAATAFLIFGCSVLGANSPSSLVCTFTPEQEQEIQDALRKPVSITGKATINPNNGKVETIAIQSLGITEHLLIGAKEFHSGRSLQQLAEAQAVEPLNNPKVLIGGWPEGEDVDEFVEDIYSSRVT